MALVRVCNSCLMVNAANEKQCRQCGAELKGLARNRADLKPGVPIEVNEPDQGLVHWLFRRGDPPPGPRLRGPLVFHLLAPVPAFELLQNGEVVAGTPLLQGSTMGRALVRLVRRNRVEVAEGSRWRIDRPGKGFEVMPTVELTASAGPVARGSYANYDYEVVIGDSNFVLRQQPELPEGEALVAEIRQGPSSLGFKTVGEVPTALVIVTGLALTLDRATRIAMRKGRMSEWRAPIGYSTGRDSGGSSPDYSDWDFDFDPD